MTARIIHLADYAGRPPDHRGRGGQPPQPAQAPDPAGGEAPPSSALSRIAHGMRTLAEGLRELRDARAEEAAGRGGGTEGGAGDPGRRADRPPLCD